MRLDAEIWSFLRGLAPFRGSGHNYVMRSASWLPILAVTAGCWQPRYFEPRENLTGTSPDGRPAAVYQVERGDDPATSGELRVWSDGAEARYGEADQEVVNLHVAIELENNGTAPLELDVGSLKVEELYLDGLLQDELQPASVAGQPLVEPGSTSRVDVVFQPPTTYPSDIDSFGVRFAVRDGSGAVVGQMTPFAPAPPRGVYGDPYWRDPYWGGAYWGGGPYGAYGPWGWSGSWGWSAGWGGLRCR